MPRSARDSDEDAELKIGRRTRMLNARAVVDSPVRRSSRIRQSAKPNKSPPESPESDASSVSNSQPIRITRQRTATMDLTAAETLKGRRTRQTSMSSDISETTDIDIVGTPKKVTRRSLIASVGTPTKTRTTRYLTRAGSESRSPTSLTRVTRKTRSSSVEPENMSEQNKSQPSTPTKMRRRASVVPSRSPVKEEIEESNDVFPTLIETVLIEDDELATSGNVDSSPDKLPHLQKSQEINEKRKSLNENKAEEDSHVKSSSILTTSDEICQPSEKMDETDNEYKVIVKVDKMESFGKGENISKKNLLLDIITSESSTDDSSFSKCKKASEAETENNLAENKQPSNETFENSATKEIGPQIENLLNISIEEERNNSSNKENQMVNTINETLTEKNGSIISNVTTLSTKHLTSALIDKPLDESFKMVKSMMINETVLNKRRHSRESIESTTKNSALSKEIIDRVEEKIDTSIDSSSPQIFHSKTDLDESLSNRNGRKKHMSCDDNELTTNDVNKSVLSKDDDIELVDKITDKNEISVENVNESNENSIDEISKLDKIDKTEETAETTVENETTNRVKSSEILPPSINISEEREINNDPKSSSSSDDNNEMKLLLEEQDTFQNENKLLNNSTKSSADCDPVHVDFEINVKLFPEARKNESIMNREQSPVTQSDMKDNSSDCREQSKKDSSNCSIEPSLEPSNVLETINSISNDSDDDNAIMKVNQSSNVIEASKESGENISSDKAELNILLKNATVTITKLKSTDIPGKHSSGEKEKNHEDLENREISDNDSDVNIGNLFQDIPAAEWKEKIKKNDNIVDNPHSDINSKERSENESEAECDLVLVDKQAWLAAESMKVANESQRFDYDSDDTVVLKSRLDAMQSINIKKLDTITEDLLIDEFPDEEGKLDKPRKPLTKRRSECEEPDSSVDTSLNKSESSLNRSNDRTASTLNKSKQSFKIYDESDEPMDTDELNRSSAIKKKRNISIRKSIERRKSLIESSKQNDQNISNISTNRAGTDDFMENIDNRTWSKEQNKKIKKAFNKSMNNEEADTIESKKKNLSCKDNSTDDDEGARVNRSVNKITNPINNETEPLKIIDLESDSSEINIPAKNFEKDLKRKTKKKINYSTVTHPRSISDDSNYNSNDNSSDSSNDNSSDNSNDNLSDNSNDISNYIPAHFFASSDSDSNSIDPDIKREYNLDAKKQKFDDDDVPGDECRASELEFSDSDDNGSDLADFIVDDEIEVEEEENQSDEQDEQNVKQDEIAEEEEIEDTDDEQDTENDDDIEEKIENVDEGQIENVKKESNKMFTKKNADKKKSIKTKMNTSKNITLDEINTHNIEDKSCTEKNEAIMLDISNLTSSNKKRKSDVKDSSSKDEEQNSMKQSNKLDMTSKKKFSKLYSSMECSTPKNSSFKQKFEIDMETFEIDTQDKQSNNTDEKKQYNSFEKKKTKKDTSKEDVNLKEFKHIDYKEESLMHKILLSDLKETVKKPGLSEASSKRAELHNTINVTHTETPTIRFLRKEKLNESAPASKLKEETNQSKKNTPDKKDITQTEVKKNKKETPDRIVLSNDDNMQESNQRKHKKRKKHAEDKSAENIDEAVSENVIEMNIPKKKKKKHDKLDQISIVENDPCKHDTHHTNKKEKKKKQIGIIEKVENAIKEANTLQKNIESNKQHGKKKKKDIEINLKHGTADNIIKKTKRPNEADEKLEDVNETNILQKDIQTSKMQLLQRDKKKKENIKTNLESADNITKIKRPNKTENKETIAGETFKTKKEKRKKNKDTTSLPQTVLKSKSNIDQNSQPEKLQNIPNSTKFENIAFAKARNEALEAIKRATEKIKLKEKLKKKKLREDRENNIKEQDEISTKQKKKEKGVEKQMLPSSTCGLKRLSSDVLDNLSDVPVRAKKKKLLRNEDKQKISSQPTTSSSKFVETKMKNSSIMPLSSCGSTTQFAVVNLEKVKKQPLNIANEIVSFRQQMFNRNKRQPIRSYMMHLRKQHLTTF